MCVCVCERESIELLLSQLYKHDCLEYYQVWYYLILRPRSAIFFTKGNTADADDDGDDASEE